MASDPDDDERRRRPGSHRTREGADIAAANLVELGRLISERRSDLRLTQADVQAAGGPSPYTMNLIEHGVHPTFRASTARQLEHILIWPAGTINSMLHGSPLPTVGDSLPAISRALSDLLLQLAPEDPRREHLEHAITAIEHATALGEPADRHLPSAPVEEREQL